MKSLISKMTCCLFILIICLGFVPGQKDYLKNNQETVIIKFAGYEYEKARYQPWMDAFNQENPGISVQFAPYPNPPSNTYYSTEGFYKFAAANADSTFNYSDMQESDQFQDLQSLIDSDPTFQPDDFWPGEMSSCQDKNGRTLGVPVNLQLHGIFYDQTAFSEAKIPVPKPGWTWDDFRQAVNTLSRKNGNGSRFGFGDADLTYPDILLPFVAAGINKNDGKLNVDKLSRDLQWYVDMVKDEKFYPTKDLINSGESSMEVDKRWAKLFTDNRQPAMWVGGPGDPMPDILFLAKMNHIINEENDPHTHLAISKFGLAPYPVEVDGSNSNTTLIAASCAVMSANSAHPRQTLLWLNFLSRQWFVFDKSPIEFTNIPARPSVADKVGFWNTLPAGAEPAVRYGLEHGLYQYPDYKTTKEVFGALDQAIAGKASLLDALKDANTRIAAISSPDPNSTPSDVATPDPTQ